MMLFEITKDGWQALKEYLNGLKDKQNYSIQVISKEKARSIKQNNYYWSMILPAILYFINDYWQLDDDLDRLHNLLKLEVSKEYYMDLIYIKDDVIKTELSINFMSMSRKQFNEYLDKILRLLPRFITIDVCSIDELVHQYCVSTGRYYKELG